MTVDELIKLWREYREWLKIKDDREMNEMYGIESEPDFDEFIDWLNKNEATK